MAGAPESPVQKNDGVMLLVDLRFKNNCIYNCKLNLYTTDCQDEVLVMRAHGSLHMHQCSYNSQGYTGRATHLFNLPSHPGSLHSDPTGVQVGHDQAKTLTGDVTHRALDSSN